ncbi:ABC transporter permease [Phytoactinopolyspora alkaliphila]|uniref:ABC transporter permease n=1 Tax=Phytoactinopolyspora alkaliphila TaxID=1783498 RepID=A0A6N9YR12_9ACTN|nr:ABC transporter permease [Phytoactinopolyspora alkaliphila]NED97268.1 ABC transporter permease [Phytoactinopolyspora alkaliphila]
MAFRRLAMVAPVLFLTSAVVFGLAAASPFDPLAGYLGDRYLTSGAAEQEQLRVTLGLDDPWYEQYTRWLGSLLSGDLGTSRVYGQPVAQVLAERLPWTMLLAGTALAGAVLGALVLGVWTAWRQGGLADRLVTGLAHALEGVPPFVSALVAIGVFALGLSWLPVAGLTDAGAEVSFGQVARHLVLPAGVLAIAQMPWLLLHVRQSLLGALGEDHVTGARARGLAARVVMLRHVLPTALLPFITLVGTRLPELVTGAILVESVFSWPGVAEAVVRSATQVDFPMLAALTLLSAVVVLLGSLIADVAYALLDPRVATDG